VLARVYIENFRSIKQLDLPLRPMTALVGPNNAGKSNILDALNLVLGEAWPTVRQFEDADHRDHDPGLPIVIKVWFDQPIQQQDPQGNALDIHGLALDLGQYQRATGRSQRGDVKLDFHAIDEHGQPITVMRPGRGGARFPAPLPVTTELREASPLVCIGVDRDLQNELRATKWSLLGRILRAMERAFAGDAMRVLEFEKRAQEASELLRIPEFQELEDILQQQVTRQTELAGLSAGFRPFTPLDHYRALALGLTEKPDGVVFDALEMGTGVQTAIVFALVQAFRRFVRESAIVAIEEPELYLHPHACRHFYKLLRELAENGTQVIYATHSSAFVDVAHFEEVVLVKRDDEGCTSVRTGAAVSLAEPERDGIKLLTRFDPTRNEMFFAERVLVVEGDAERMAMPLAFQLSGVDADRANISIVAAGGKPGVPFFAQMLAGLRIPFVALVDEDPGKTTGEALTQRIQKLAGDVGTVVLMRPDFEGACGADHKLGPAEALRVFGSYGSAHELPAAIREAIEKLTG